MIQLARPKMRDVDKDMVLRLVEENAKKRFELVFGYDPSPPPPKKGKGQNKGKGKGQGQGQGGKKVEEVASGVDAVEVGEKGASAPGEPVTAPEPPVESATASVDALPVLLSPAQITSTELPLVILPDPAVEEVSDPDPRGGYYIRASQGHSIALEGVAHLEAVLDDEEGRKRAGLIVHGTRWDLWETLSESQPPGEYARTSAEWFPEQQGLSRMARQHIHFAPALSLSEHHIIPRPNSTLLIYLDLPRALAAGIPVYTSANGVVLTPGNEAGSVGKEFWRLAEKVEGGLQGARTVVWRDGKEVKA